MATYAEINTENIVVNCIVADAEFVATQTDKTYVEYNDTKPAGIGYTYDEARDAFIPPKPYPSWILNEDTCRWEAPIPYPNDGVMYSWDEEAGDWVAIVFQQENKELEN